MDSSQLTPKRIIEELDKYIVGQQEAKKWLSISWRNRFRKKHAPPSIRKEIAPSNILISGPTGVGKTACARRMAQIAKSPFLKVDATQFTERGYVGESISSIIPKLVAQAYRIIKEKYQKQITQEVNQEIEEQLIQSLIQEATSIEGREGERLCTQLRKGLLEKEVIQIELTAHRTLPPMGGENMPAIMDEQLFKQFKDIFDRIAPAEKKKKIKVTVAQARKMLFEQAIDQKLDYEKIKQEALQLAEEEGIIFIDEIDKIAYPRGKQNSQPDVSRGGVQRDLLSIMDGTTVSTKYGTLDTRHILFICAGAFHTCQPADLIPELQGRLPIRVEMDPLQEEDLIRILQEPRNALVLQYQGLMEAEGVNLTFDQDVYAQIGRFAHQQNQMIENIGARRLETIMNQLLSDFLFDVPDKIGPGAQLRITKEHVEQKLQNMSKKESRYIL